MDGLFGIWGLEFQKHQRELVATNSTNNLAAMKSSYQTVFLMLKNEVLLRTNNY